MRRGRGARRRAARRSARGDRRAAGGGRGSPTRSRGLRGAPNVRLLPRTTAFGYGIGNMVALAERLTDHLPPTEARGAARAAVAGPRARRRDRDRLDRAAAGVPQQRPARRHAGVGGAQPAQPLRRAAGRARGGRGQPRQRLSGRVRARRGGRRRSPRSSMRAPTPAADLAARAARARDRGDRRRAPVDTRRQGCGSTASPSRGARRHAQARLRPAADGGRLDAQRSPVLAIARQGRVGRGACRRSCPARRRKRERRSAPAAAASRSTTACAKAGRPAAAIRPRAPRAGDARPRRRRSARRAGERRRQRRSSISRTTSPPSDIRLAVREGFRSVEHIKRYTTNGMATDQGRTSNLNALAIAAQALGRRSRAPASPPFARPIRRRRSARWRAIRAGDLFDPVRKTPLDARAVAAGAVFEPVGQWRRARYFPQAGEDMHAAVSRECRAGARRRRHVRRVDASARSRWSAPTPPRSWTCSTSPPRPSSASASAAIRCCCARTAIISDDGVIARLAPDRFHVTTTTGGAANVLHVMEDFRQTEFPHLKVWLTSTTEQWAVIVVNGPRARDTIAPLVEGIDLSPDALPAHDGARGHASRACRAGCSASASPARSGSRSTCPPRSALAVWDAIAAAGEPHGLTLYGTEAMHVLRAEKGYIIVGQDTDGTVTPDDAGLGKMVATKKPDFVGKRSLMRPAMARRRPQAAGRPVHDRRPHPAGGRRADRRSRRADPLARPCQLVLSQRRGRPPDRAGAGARRAGADGRSRWRWRCPAAPSR